MVELWMCTLLLDMLDVSLSLSTNNLNYVVTRACTLHSQTDSHWARLTPSSSEILSFVLFFSRLLVKKKLKHTLIHNVHMMYRCTHTHTQSHAVTYIFQVKSCIHLLSEKLFSENFLFKTLDMKHKIKTKL